MHRELVRLLVFSSLSLVACTDSTGGGGDAGDASTDVTRKADAAGDAKDDGSSDAASCAQCGDACVDLATDKMNCGGCAVDCSGGDCSSGICTLANLDASAACLALFQQNVLVTTSDANDAGTVLAVPSIGGSPTFASTTGLPSGPIVADATDAYWAQWTTYVTYIQDALSATWFATNVNTAAQGASPIVHAMAMNDQHVAWLDDSANLCTSSRSFLSCATTSAVGTTGNEHVALSGDSAFVTADRGASGSLCQIALPSSQSPSCAIWQGPGIGPIVVDDPNGSSPNLFFTLPQVVMTATSVTGAWSIFASGAPSSTLALVYVDASTLYLSGPNGIYKTSSSTVVPVVQNVHPTGRCLVVDAQSVYWLDGMRVRKAAR